MLSCTIAPSFGPSRAPPRLLAAVGRLQPARGDRCGRCAGPFVRGVRAAASAAPVRNSSPRRARARWIAAWSASPEPATPRVLFEHGFENQTVRNIVFTSAAGRVARVRFSNAFGQQPLDIGSAALGRAQDGPAVAPRSNIPLICRSTVGGGPARWCGRERSCPFARSSARAACGRRLPTAPDRAPSDHLTAKQTNYVQRATACSTALRPLSESRPVLVFRHRHRRVEFGAGRRHAGRVW